MTRYVKNSVYFLLFLLFLGFADRAEAKLNDGLYVANGTDILFIRDPGSTSSNIVSVLKQDGRVTGLAYDKNLGYLFWSDINRLKRPGIYRASTDETGNLVNVRQIIGRDVMEVNCLTYDWISKNIYWTDGKKKTVEVSNADGRHRRILIIDGLSNPRGIYADPIHGFLFWNDQGQGRQRIERSQLDGSERRNVTTTDVNLPNQILVHNNKLYWVDAYNKTFESSDLDGGNRRRPVSVSGPSLADDKAIFGLAMSGGRAYITSWNNGRLINVNVDGTMPTAGAGNLGNGAIFNAIFVHADNQPLKSDQCSTKGCSHLCLPVSLNETRCTCPSFGGLTLEPREKKACRNPTNILLFALADCGYVAFYDAENTGGDFTLVGRSLRPVALAYDPVDKNVYWSDVSEKTIHRSDLTGSRASILLQSQNGIGYVEGMVIDPVRRQLFYTNRGAVVLGRTPYSWHRVETIRLDSSNPIKIKILVDVAQKPRALAIDSANGHLYYTDWGSRASVVRTNLDGSNPTLIRTGLDNPNGITILNNRIYIVDSHHKTRQSGNKGNYPSPVRNGAVYSMAMDGSGFRELTTRGSPDLFGIPFGLTSSGNSSTSGALYVSDWETKQLLMLSVEGVVIKTIFRNVSDIMSIVFTSVDYTSPVVDPCTIKRCDDICLSKSSSESTCSCNSFNSRFLRKDDASTCSAPSSFVLLADMNSIKLVSLDEKDSSTTNIIVQGSPTLSNFVGLAYAAENRMVYYSEVNRKVIHSISLTNTSQVEEFYSVNHAIDGMVVHGGRLFWTDSTNGRILYLSLKQDKSVRQHTVFQSGLDKPRGIKVYKDYVYWTERGGAPRVARSPLSGKSAQIVQVILQGGSASNSTIVWPNGIHIDEKEEKLYVVDGFFSSRKIFKCSLDGRVCDPLPNVNDTVKHAYDISVVNGTVYYSDWLTGSIYAYSRNLPKDAWPIVQGLMRPTQMYIQFTPSVSNCLLGSCSNGECVSLLNVHGCDCRGQPSDEDGRLCYSAGTHRCSYNGNSVSVGKTFKPGLCVECKCLGRVSYADSVYNDSVCTRTECPEVKCPPGAEPVRNSRECCPVCSKSCTIDIINCPPKEHLPIVLILPPDADFVQHDFQPQVEDCSGIYSDVAFSKVPASDLYRSTVQVIVRATAKKRDGRQQEYVGICKYQIEVRDETPPSITCPTDTVVYTHENNALNVKWDPPQIYDNAGPPPGGFQSKPSREWGSTFAVGEHRVTYTVTDMSGLRSSCTFKVTVEKLVRRTETQKCTIPRLQNGNLRCSADEQAALVCSVECSDNFTLNAGSPSNLTCTVGEIWQPDIDNNNFELLTCIRKMSRYLRGSLIIRLPKACRTGTDLNYTRDYLQSRIRDTYLPTTRSHKRLTSSVTSFGCGILDQPGSSSCKGLQPNEICVTVEVSAQYRSNENLNATGLTSDVTKTLRRIEEHLNKEFLRVTLLDSTGLRAFLNPNVTFVDVTLANCLPGEIEKGSECGVCPVGTHQETPHECRPCQVDTYNDVPGQTNCKTCPGGNSTDGRTGSYIVYQCSATTKFFDIFTNYSVHLIAAGIAIFVVIVVIISVVVACKRRNRRKRLEIGSDVPAPQTVGQNGGKCGAAAAVDEDETYDKIGLPDDTYDVIGETPMESCAAGCTDETYEKPTESNNNQSTEKTPTKGNCYETVPMVDLLSRGDGVRLAVAATGERAQNTANEKAVAAGAGGEAGVGDVQYANMAAGAGSEAGVGEVSYANMGALPDVPGIPENAV